MFIPNTVSSSAVAAVVPNVDFSQVDLSKLTVGFEFEFISKLSHKAFARALKMAQPTWVLGVVRDDHGLPKNIPDDKKYSGWNVTSDETVQEDTEDLLSMTPHYSIELISPVLKLSQVADVLDRVFKLIKSTGGTTNDSCGLHVTFGHPDLNSSLTKFDPLKLGIFLREDNLLARFGRTDNSYADNLSKRIIGAINTELAIPEDSVTSLRGQNVFSEEPNKLPVTDKTGPKLTDANLEKVLLSPAFRKRMAMVDHYTNISLQYLPKHRVEIRGMGGNYLAISTKEFTGRILHMARCVVISLMPKAYVPQYIAAVRKMMAVYSAPKQSMWTPAAPGEDD